MTVRELLKVIEEQNIYLDTEINVELDTDEDYDVKKS